MVKTNIRKIMQKKLFKKDSSEKIRYLLFSVVGDTITQTSGVLDSPNPVTHSKRATGKNIGKTNETTPQEQALLEVQAAIKQKLTEGYFESQEEAEKIEVILPMLAKSFKDESKKVDWTYCYVQPKLDGMRCLAFIDEDHVTLLSRDGKEIQNMEHIKEALKQIKGTYILDGELYNKDLGSFQNQMKAIKKYTKGLSEQINYNVYDCITPGNFLCRFVEAKQVLTTISSPYLYAVPTTRVYNIEQVKDNHIVFLSLGYEGTIIRWGDAEYKVNGRSSNLLKYKDFQDIALTIKDIVPAEQRPEWGKPIFELNGKEFSAGMKYSHEDRIDFLINKNKYIGKTAEVRYFEYTDEGLLRFPVMFGIRLDK